MNKWGEDKNKRNRIQRRRGSERGGSGEGAGREQGGRRERGEGRSGYNTSSTTSDYLHKRAIAIAASVNVSCKWSNKKRGREVGNKIKRKERKNKKKKIQKQVLTPSSYISSLDEAERRCANGCNGRILITCFTLFVFRFSFHSFSIPLDTLTGKARGRKRWSTCGRQI